MKKKSLKLRLPYFFGQRIHRTASLGNIIELMKLETKLQRGGGESGIEDILRWADDGGKMLDLIENRTARSNPDAARERKSQ